MRKHCTSPRITFDLNRAHLLLTGASRGIGRELVDVLAARGARLALVARNAEALEQIVSELGADRATAFPCDLGDASAIDGLIARVESEDAESKLKRAGADRVISPYAMGAIQMAHTALRPAVVDFMRLATSSEHIDLSAEQIELAPHGTLVGKSIREAELRQRYGVIVVAIRRREGHMEFNPSPESRLHGGDQLVLLGSAEKLRELDVEARPPARRGEPT